MKPFLNDWRKVLVAVVFLGAFLRFFHLGETSFVADEFLDINSSYGYFKTKEWQAWDFNLNQPDTLANANQARDERAFVYKWQVAELFHFLPPTEANARVISALWGLITILVVFRMTVFLTKRKEMGLVAAFLVAVSISALIIDRRLRMYAMFVPVFVAFSYASFRALEGEYTGKIALVRTLWQKMGINGMWVLPAFFLGALSLHLHLLTANSVFIVVAYAGVMAVLARRAQGRWTLNKYTAILGAFVAGLIGLRIFAHQSFQLLVSSFSFPDNHYEYANIALKDFSQPLLAMLCLTAGVWFLLKQENKTKEGWWLALSFAVPIFFAVFVWRRNVGEQYIAFVQPFKTMLVAIGIYAIALFFDKHLKKVFGNKAFAWTLILLLLLVPNYGYFFQSDNTYHQTAQSDNPQYRKVFGFVMKNYVTGEVMVTRDLRAYYMSGAKMPLENIGGEITKDKLTLDRLQSIQKQYVHGWVVLSDNDAVFVSNEAMTFIQKSMERMSHPAVRGQISVYHW
jgi:hypothetical protein